MLVTTPDFIAQFITCNIPILDTINYAYHRRERETLVYAEMPVDMDVPELEAGRLRVAFYRSIILSAVKSLISNGLLIKAYSSLNGIDIFYLLLTIKHRNIFITVLHRIIIHR